MRGACCAQRSIDVLEGRELKSRQVMLALRKRNSSKAIDESADRECRMPSTRISV